MKKKHLISYIFMFAIAIAMAFAGFITLSPKSALAEEQSMPEPEPTIFNYITISQQDHIFSMEDFEEEKIENTIYQNLYTNKTVTITLDKEVKDGDHFKIEETKNGASVQIGDADTRVLILNGVKSYVFDASKLTADKTTTLTISYEKLNYDQKTHEYYYNVYSINLKINQLTNNFFNSTEFKWDYVLAGAPKSVSAPSNNYEYPPLALTIPKGTETNPISIRFVYLGETYEIYNINGFYFNAIDDTPLNIENIYFDKSGTYTVEIFDKTMATNYGQKNYLKYNFTIENTTDQNNRYAPFYISAHVESGAELMNNQISNEKTTLEFINLNMIRTYIDRVVVRKSYRPTGGQNITEETSYTGINLPTSLTFETDGTYHIFVIGINNGNIIKEFEFILIESIRSFFEVDGTRYEISAEEPANTTKIVPIERTVESHYNNILGKTTYTFDVIIARSAPSINGVSNNARTSNTINLTASGVGKISVTVSQDGKIHNLELENGELIGTFSEPGKYFIKITDEMGTTVTKSFTLTVKMNGAALALIIIGAVLVLFMFIVAIISRSRIKVR